MPTIRLTLNTVSPAFIQGADSRGTPELRVPSLRGQLRYWGRAVWGARSSVLQNVWNDESAIFGSTGEGSRVLLRLTPSKKMSTATFPMLPHRGPNDRRSSPTKAIEQDGRCFLDVVTRPGEPIPADFNTALSLFLLLGGMGKRSRRMFGGFQLTKFRADDGVIIPAWWENIPATPEAHANAVREVLSSSLANMPNASRVPSFPTLHPGMSWVLVGKRTFDSPEEANIRLFHDLLRGPYREHEHHFGHAMRGRRASPLIAQVRRAENGEYFPVLTYMRSNPEERDTVKVINDFLNDATHVFQGELAWGGLLS